MGYPRGSSSGLPDWTTLGPHPVGFRAPPQVSLVGDTDLNCTRQLVPFPRPQRWKVLAYKGMVDLCPVAEVGRSALP
jgi:hypothetical protein